MGEALVKGIVASKTLTPSQIIISDARTDRLAQLQEKYKVKTATSNTGAVDSSDVVILAVKPQQLDSVLEEIANSFSNKHVVVSIAAGVSTERILQKVKKDISLVRVMPNSPALIGRGISVVSPSELATEEAVDIAFKLFSGVGEVVLLEEKYQNEATALSGSGPAYFYLLVEALIDSGAKAGLSREVSSQLVTETIAGSAKMLKETGKQPASLREMVTSPGGTTAAALAVFEKVDFRGIVADAVKAAVKRAEELG